MFIVIVGWVGEILKATIVTIVVSFILLNYKEIKDYEKNDNELQAPTPDDDYAKAKQAIDKKVEDLRKELTSELDTKIAVHIFKAKYPNMYTIASHVDEFAGVVLGISMVGVLIIGGSYKIPDVIMQIWGFLFLLSVLILVLSFIFKKAYARSLTLLPAITMWLDKRFNQK